MNIKNKKQRYTLTLWKNNHKFNNRYMKSNLLKAKILLITGLLLLSTPLLLAFPNELDQQKVISGIVTDEIGDPLIGVSVVVKGTTKGTITDLDGKYTIEVSETESLLEFTYVGFTSQTISIKNKTMVNVVLSEDAKQLEEVVVVGYGTQKKVNLTGAVTSIEGATISSKSTSDALSALQGEMPGVAVLRSSGQPGSEASGIRIRGFSSINDASALVLIDGVEGSLATINPQDIANISVLKDAAAAAIYGAKSAAGVILVTTKSGADHKGGKAKISYNGYFAINTPTRVPKRLPAWEEQEFINESRIQEKGSPEWNEERTSWVANPNFNYRPNTNNRWDYFEATNWIDEGTRDYTTQQSHNVSISGGSKQLNYLVSAGYFKKNGYLKYGPDKNDRYNLRVRLNAELNKYLDLGIIASYDGKFNETIPFKNASGRDNGAKNVLSSLYLIRGRQPIFTPEEDPSNGGYNGDLHVNPIDIMKNGGIDELRSESMMAKGEITVKNLFKGFKLKLNAARRASYYSRKVERHTLIWYGMEGTNKRNSANDPSELQKTRYYRFRDNFEALAYYDLNIKKHSLNVLAGASYENYRNDQISGLAKNLNSDEIFTFSGYDSAEAENSRLSDAISTSALMSYFGRINYNYNERYLFEANIRIDGSSKLEPGNRWKAFPSFSGAWRISEEKWFKVPFIDNLKARASWGQLGIGDVLGDYDYLALLNSGNHLGEKMFYQSKLPSKGKTWEIVETTNIGFDINMFSNRLTLTADYYWKSNKDMIINYTLPSTVGVSAPSGNLGQMKMWGWEFEIGWRDRIRNLNYQISFNISDSQNEITKLDNASEIWAGTVKLLEGYPMHTLWGYQTDGFWSSREEYLAYKEANPGYMSYSNDAKIAGGDVKYIAQGDGKHKVSDGGTVEDPGDLIYLGNSTGRYLYGINLSLQWNNFDFSMLWQGVAKRKILIDTETIAPFYKSQNMPWTIHRNYWTPDNPNSYWPRLYNGSSFNFQPSDRWVQDASYIRLKNVQLGYTIPFKKKNIIDRFRVYVSGDDVWEHSDLLDVFDPEVGNKASANYYPFFRTWTVGVNLTF